MAKDDSEERNLPASQKKLRDARKKGQVPKSKDLTSGVALAGSLTYLLLGSAAIVSACLAMFEQAALVANGDFHAGLASLAPVLGHAALRALAPILLIVPLSIVLVSMMVMKGVPLAMDPIIPKMQNINPADGFKKLFQLKSLVELVKSVLKTAVIVCVFVVVFTAGLNALVLAPGNGLATEIAVLHHLALPMLAAAALLFVVAGGADYAVQRWLFLREQKMSVTEMKRERKDADGDPHVKRERNRIMREALRLAGGLGLKRATMIVHDGGRTTIGLRYKINEMPAPVVVCRARGDRGSAMLHEASALGLPMAEDGELAVQLAGVPLGHGIPEKYFRSVALALRRAGTV